MIFPHFLDEGDHWEFYHFFEGEFPSKEDLKTLKGIIIAGNIESVNSDVPIFLSELPKELKIVSLGKLFVNKKCYRQPHSNYSIWR